MRCPVIVLVLLVLTPALAFGQTCDQLRAEIAALLRTLSNEQNSLSDCESHPGSCTPGQISGIRQAIQIAQEELDVDRGKLSTTCNTPPPPNFDHVTLEGVEVTQAIQDLDNSVPLIAGKKTWVRVYLGKLSGTRTISGTLVAKRDTSSVTLTALAPITIDSTENLTTRRRSWTKSLDFAVPAAMLSSGTTIFTIGTLSDTSASPKRIICDDCAVPTQVSFSRMPPLLIRVVNLTYPFQSSPSAPLVTISPRTVDTALLQSWLGRAYPVSNTTFIQSTTASTSTTGVVGTGPAATGTFTCDSANIQLLATRATEISSGGDTRTHYLAVVSNQGFFMRGCAAQDKNGNFLTSASGPSGVPASVTIGAGDTDASFGDWYGGHELGHTFNRFHPGFCGESTDDLLAFPYPKGQISDAKERSFAGLDVGDTANGISLSVLWGSATFDIMTYCVQPQWLSAYTYQGVRLQLLSENPGFKPLKRAFQRDTSTMLVGPSVHVVAEVNLTKLTGSFGSVIPVTRALPSSTPNSRAEFVVRDATGKELFRQSAPIFEMTDLPDGADRLGLIDTSVPFREDMAQIQLELDGAVVARYANDQIAPPAVRGVKFARESGEAAVTITWSPSPPSSGQVTFTAQTSVDTKSWLTIGVGLSDPLVTLAADQANAQVLRVTANNGFRSSPPVDINLCSAANARTVKLESDVNKLKDLIDSGEVPVNAQLLARLRSLRRDLANASAQLSRCQARNP
jgi:hypothetical protein